jgi:oligopeptide transport system permease protein
MARYIFGRLGGLIVVFIIVSIVTFSLMHAVPGGPFDEEKQPLPPAAKANVLRKYGLDRPVWEQYLRYMSHAVRGDFGIPYQSPTETVTGLISRVWPPTLALGLMTLIIAFGVGITLGVLAAYKQNSPIDYFVTAISTFGFAMPNFVIGIWLIMILSVSLHWLPTGGWGEPKHYIMPLLAYSLAPMAMVARYTRVSTLEALHADFARTARAKGLTESAVMTRHVLRNGLIPMITVLGPIVPNILTGSIFIEMTFRIPGLGRYFVTSVTNRDYPMIMALMLMVALLWSVTYLLSDILYTMVDPRVRLGGQSKT